jgi:hypothetical protein
MTISKDFRVAVLAFATVLALSACGKKEAPPPPAANPAPAPATPAPAPATPAPAAVTTTVTAVNLGNALGPDGKVTAHRGAFAPKDTIYAEVATTSTGGAGTASIEAAWTYGDGQPVTKNSESISTAAGTATTTFHISKPDGLPAANYKVEISVDGKSASSQTFEVK